ncbi:MAG: aminoglycoside phosphotransferase family protein [Bacteroidetes bacterium]|nr:aminoglycoside phosphotransferase family protein [Bacteroidota bacterium]
MKKTLQKEVINAFSEPDEKYTIEQLGNGLINHTFKISEKSSGKTLLIQQINKNVFKKPLDVQDNYLKLFQYKNGSKQILFPSPVELKNNQPLFIDADGNYWRAFEFLDETITLDVPQNAKQAYATAKTFGQITAFLSSFNAEELNIVIPDFHNLSFRYKQFEAALKKAKEERLKKAITLIEEVRKREYKNFYEQLITRPTDFPKRVMHHDAKIANVLFDKKTGNVICAIDFDTTMPGYFFSDLGDMIRSMACSSDEHNTDFEKLHIRKDFYKAIVNGYLEVMNDYLTTEEKKYIHSAGLIMIYMQAVRFIADYLNNDTYYQISYPEQNFDRGLNQVTLLKNLEEFLSEEYNFRL